MKVCDYMGFEIHFPTTGGKAGKGHNVTGSIQIRKDRCVIKQFRFSINAIKSRTLATAKAKEWIHFHHIVNAVGHE